MDKIIQDKFDNYPDQARKQLLKIRKAVFEVAEKEGVGEVTETLKWGEPSYVVKKGSTLRMDWKAKSPDTFSMFFSCQSLLVETFREVYKDTFHFVGNREIVFPLKGALPMKEIKGCISMALRYHNIKHLPFLGAYE